MLLLKKKKKSQGGGGRNLAPVEQALAIVSEGRM